jgi:hypothetical protein
LPTADPFDGARPAKGGRQQIADRDLLDPALAVRGADRRAPQEADGVAMAAIVAVVMRMTAVMVVPVTIVVIVPVTIVVIAPAAIVVITPAAIIVIASAIVIVTAPSIIIAIVARLRRRDRREPCDGRPEPDDSADVIR